MRQATFSVGYLARNPLTLEDVGWLNGLLYRLTIRCKISSRLIGYCYLADDFRLQLIIVPSLVIIIIIIIINIIIIIIILLLLLLLLILLLLSLWGWWWGYLWGDYDDEEEDAMRVATIKQNDKHIGTWDPPETIIIFNSSISSWCDAVLVIGIPAAAAALSFFLPLQHQPFPIFPTNVKVRSDNNHQHLQTYVQP